jgi:hypothetical protein
MHIYSACAVGVGAVLTNPAAEASWAASCLPIIGGRSFRQEGPVDWPSVADPVLHFDFASTEITGRQTGFNLGAEEYTTSIRKTVTNLNILNKVIGSVDVLFTFLYTRASTGASPKQRDPVEVSVVLLQPLSLTINGAALPATFSFRKQIMNNAGKDFKKFQTSGPDTINADRPGTEHLEHEHGGNGKTETADINTVSSSPPWQSPKAWRRILSYMRIRSSGVSTSTRRIPQWTSSSASGGLSHTGSR